MAHVAGLIAAGVYPNPVPHAHVVTTTTHKTLAGPRGGLILSNEGEDLYKKLKVSLLTLKSVMEAHGNRGQSRCLPIRRYGSRSWPNRGRCLPEPSSTRARCYNNNTQNASSPRGGLILSNEGEDLYKKLNSAVFPGGQGGPLMHVIAGKAVAFKEALEPEFKEYQARVVANAKAMVAEFLERGYNIVSGSTENHLFLVDLINKDITGKEADAALGAANITVNKNSVPNDHAARL